MPYIAKFYSLETWEIEEVGEFDTIDDVKDVAKGRVYELTVVPRTHGADWAAMIGYAAFYLFLLALGFGVVLLLGYFVR